MKKPKPMYVVELKRKKNVPLPPDVEEAFNEHYNNVHLPLMSKVPGIVEICRYKSVPGQYLGTQTEGDRYIAVYEIENEDIIERTLSSPERKRALDDHVLFDYIKRYFDSTSIVYVPITSK